MFIENAAIAKEMLRVINISKLESAYRVRLEPKTNALQWVTVDGDQEIVLGVEPESSSGCASTTPDGLVRARAAALRHPIAA
jgi:putative cardiolipin synthase